MTLNLSSGRHPHAHAPHKRCTRMVQTHVQHPAWCRHRQRFTCLDGRGRVKWCTASAFQDDAYPAYGAAGIPVDTIVHQQQLWDVLMSKPEAFAANAIHTLQQLTEVATPEDQQPSTSGVHDQAAEVMYIWALAEAYCTHPLLQETMRMVLRREGMGPLAMADSSPKAIANEVVLMPGATRGSYKVGSVCFANGVSSSSVLTSAGGFGVLSSLGFEQESEAPRSISRAAAARAYTMYMHWGYFNRHMTRRRAATKALLGEEYVDRGSDRVWLDRALGTPPRLASPYGDVPKVFRYFENVPDELSEMRTAEARSVGERHVGMLYGEAEECITTLGRWRHMCDEAQCYGRALYDAEQVAIDAAPALLHETWQR